MSLSTPSRVHGVTPAGVADACSVPLSGPLLLLAALLGQPPAPPASTSATPGLPSVSHLEALQSASLRLGQQTFPHVALWATCCLCGVFFVFFKTNIMLKKFFSLRALEKQTLAWGSD